MLTINEIKKNKMELEKLIKKLNDDLDLLKSDYTFEDLCIDVRNTLNTSYNEPCYKFWYKLNRYHVYLSTVLTISAPRDTSIIIQDFLIRYVKNIDRCYEIVVEQYDNDILSIDLIDLR